MSQSVELKELKLRLGEKKFYKEMNSSNDLRFPFAKPNEIADYPEKVNLLIQAVLGHLELPNYDGAGKHVMQFSTDKNIIWQHLHRLIKCLIDCKIYFKDGTSLRSALDLMRSTSAEIWDNSPLVLLQVDGIGPVSMRKLVNCGICSIEDFRLCDNFRLEHALGLSSGRGTKLLQDVDKIPKFRVSLKKISESRAKDGVNVAIGVMVHVANNNIAKFFHRKLLTVSMLVDLSDGELVELRRAVY